MTENGTIITSKSNIYHLLETFELLAQLKMIKDDQNNLNTCLFL